MATPDLGDTATPSIMIRLLRNHDYNIWAYSYLHMREIGCNEFEQAKSDIQTVSQNTTQTKQILDSIKGVLVEQRDQHTLALQNLDDPNQSLPGRRCYDDYFHISQKSLSLAIEFLDIIEEERRKVEAEEAMAEEAEAEAAEIESEENEVDEDEFEEFESRGRIRSRDCMYYHELTSNILRPNNAVEAEWQGCTILGARFGLKISQLDIIGGGVYRIL
ncbi:hypothetical protein MMC06_000983 [Schaereria dolodes]|nr:hypothetical protein [Schaereria dolodes]